MIDEQRRIRAELEEYFVRLVEDRRRSPRDDLLTGLVQAELEGSRLAFDELLAMLILLLVAGNETTTNLIGNAALELLAHPDALAAVRADPSLTAAAVEEVLRFSSPVQMDPRIAPRDVTVQDVTIPAGEFVLCWIGSANRDGTVFERADTFDVRREKQQPPRLRLRPALLSGRLARHAGGGDRRPGAAPADTKLRPGRRGAAAAPSEHRLPGCDQPAGPPRAGVIRCQMC